jgi:hypothetical protein
VTTDPIPGGRYARLASSASERAPQPTNERARLGLSPIAFAGLALLAIVTARALAPALPGSAIGIARLIVFARFVAACASQLVAAGGIVLCLRLLGRVFALPSLGVAFRVIMAPVGLGVISLVAASAARPLGPTIGKLLPFAAVVACASVAPFLLSRRWMRPVGVGLLLLAAAQMFELLAYEGMRPGTVVDSLRFGLASAGELTSILLDVAFAGVCVAFCAEKPARIAGCLLGALALAMLAMTLADAGEARHASGAWVLLHRSLAAIAQRPLSSIAVGMSEVSSLLALVLGAVVLALPGRPPALRAALCLCMLGTSGGATPLGALLTVAGALMLAAVSVEPHAAPERSLVKRST